jgi:5-(carboxyamino)imidazole ribonucleotide mutase
VNAQKSADPLVGVIMGSDSDADTMKGCLETLAEFGIPYEVRVISAHRTPDAAHQYAVEAAGRGLVCLIAAAGGAAHLAGVLASLTALPVIGVPVQTSSLGGLDSLLSTVQMPAGVPVATVGIGKSGPVNAAILAVQILAQGRPDLRAKLEEHKVRLAQRVKDADRKMGNADA